MIINNYTFALYIYMCNTREAVHLLAIFDQICFELQLPAAMIKILLCT